MYMTLLREIARQGAPAVIPRILEIIDHIPQEWERRKYADLLSSCGKKAKANKANQLGTLRNCQKE